MSQDPPHILLAHGGGGELTRHLIEDHIVPRIGNDTLNPLDDGAILDLGGARACFTTDAFVVQPLEFPGADIGRLAVCGTVNDLAAMGARPVALSLALVIEEGLAIETLDRILDSIARAAEEAGVRIATGDTKVVERGRGDGMTITTAGVGALAPEVALGVERIQPGDAIIITGRIADHGLAVMSVREGLAFQTEIRSDAAPLASICQDILRSGGDAVRFLRDPTRSGLAGLVADLAETTGLTAELDEAAIPISPTVRHASEMLGLDPLTAANEGKMVAVVSADAADRVLEACRAHPLGAEAAVVGWLTGSQPPLAELVTRIGGRRIIQRPYGEELPRIC